MTILLEHHRQHLSDEGFTPDQISTLVTDYGVRSLDTQTALELGFKLWNPELTIWQSSSGILFPFAGGFAQLKCDRQ